MPIPEHLLTIFAQLGFVYDESNQYTQRQRFCRKIRNLSVRQVDYYNPAILLETIGENYIIFKIVGYRTIDDKVIDISRILYPGVCQFLYYDRIFGSGEHLQWYRANAISKYAL